MDEELAHEFRIALPKADDKTPPFPSNIVDRPPADDQSHNEVKKSHPHPTARSPDPLEKIIHSLCYPEGPHFSCAFGH